MYSRADFSITPRPMYPADGRKVFDIYTHPASIREDIKTDLGDFPFPNFWGPIAGIKSSQWIAESAKWIERRHEPTLNLVYLPHLDYNLQRLGPNHPDIRADVAAIDAVVGDLITFFQSRSVQVVLLSEYGITEVDRPIHLNRLFRERGWIAIREELGLELLDCGASRVFAVADHQIAHVYINDPSIVGEVRGLLEQQPGMERILGADEQAAIGIDHARSGDLVAVADARSWFTYYYWQDDRRAPDFARCVDIHRKPGYDPVELFVDPALAMPKLKIAATLLRKKLCFRTLMDVIPLDASLVRGSHGRMPEAVDYPLFVTPQPDMKLPATIEATDVRFRIEDCIG
jgi:predicted AlkP superfamily pyrophosphatase or phosphodiesterase